MENGVIYLRNAPQVLSFASAVGKRKPKALSEIILM